MSLNRDCTVHSISRIFNGISDVKFQEGTCNGKEAMIGLNIRKFRKSELGIS